MGDRVGQRLVLVGEPEFRLEIVVSGYEFPDTTVGDDADWLYATLDLKLAGLATARIGRDPFLRTDELDAFRADVAGLIAGRADVAELRTLEEQIELRIERSEQGTQIEGSVTNHVTAKLEFEEITVEAASLASLHADLDALAAAFPVRSGFS